jgi:DNA-binding NtrC family response regulator
MDKKTRIIFIEDNQFYAETILAGMDGNPEYTIEHIPDADGLKQINVAEVDVFILDYFLKNQQGELKTGESILDTLNERCPGKPVIMLTGLKEIEKAMALLKKGATDYIVKDEFALDNLTNTLEKIREVKAYKEQIWQLEDKTKRYKRRLLTTMSGIVLTIAALLWIYFLS